jgi:hypothetical protein
MNHLYLKSCLKKDIETPMAEKRAANRRSAKMQHLRDINLAKERLAMR